MREYLVPSFYGECVERCRSLKVNTLLIGLDIRSRKKVTS